MIALTFEKRKYTCIIKRTDNSETLLTIELIYNPGGEYASVYTGEASVNKTQRHFRIDKSDTTGPQGLINLIQYISDYIIAYQILETGLETLSVNDVVRINKFVFSSARRIIDYWYEGGETL